MKYFLATSIVSCDAPVSASLALGGATLWLLMGVGAGDVTIGADRGIEAGNLEANNDADPRLDTAGFQRKSS